MYICTYIYIYVYVYICNISSAYFSLPSAIRDIAAETVYKEHCIPVNNGTTWARYMSIGGNAKDEYDIITLQYTEDGLLSVDENRDGHAAAFGDDIAIESLATEYRREIYVVITSLAFCIFDNIQMCVYVCVCLYVYN